MRLASTRKNEDQACVFRSLSSEGLRLIWEITSACNLHCEFCLVRKKKNELTLERCIALARELAAHDVRKFLITGGEPLMHGGITGLLTELLSLDVTIKILTNGTVHQPDVFRLIRDNSSIEVSLSLLSVDPVRSDDIFQGTRTLSRIERTIDLVSNSQLNVIAAVGTFNRQEVGQIIDWVADHGVPCLSLTDLYQDTSMPARFLHDCRIYRISDSEVARLFRLIEEKREQYSGQMVIRTTQFQRCGHERCEAGKSVLYLDSTGCLLPCTMTHNEKYRPLLEGKSISEAMALLKSISKNTPDSSCHHLLEHGVREPVREIVDLHVSVPSSYDKASGT